MSGLGSKIIEERIGRMSGVFHIQKVGSIAGSFVLDGKVNRNASARIMRDGEQIFAAERLAGSRNALKMMSATSTGYECGIAVEGYKDVQEGTTGDYRIY